MQTSPPDSASPAAGGDAHRHGSVGALAGAIRVVASLTLVSRLAGLVRDVITAHVFGDGLVASAFRFAYAIPNLFRRLFGEGALSAAFLPRYAQLRKHDPVNADRLASLVLSLLTLGTGAITLVLVALLLLTMIFIPPPAERGLQFKLIVLMLPMMPMVCVTAILGGVLQVRGRFGPPAAAPIILNAFQIAAGVWFLFVMGGNGARASQTDLDPGQITAAYAIGASAVVASLVQVVWSLLALRGLVNWTRTWTGAGEHARGVLASFLPVVVGLGTLQLNTMLDTVVASWPTLFGPTMFGFTHPLDVSSNAILSYTQSLYQFPLGVFGIAVATAVFPLLSRSADDPERFADVLHRGLRLSLFIGLPASVGLVLVRHDLVGVVYSGWSAGGIERGAMVLLGYAPAVWAYSLNHVFTRAFYARGDTRTPVRVSMSMVAMNVALNFSLLWVLREAGLAVSTACTAMVQCIVMGALCSRRLGVSPLDRGTFRGALRTVLASAAMAGCVALVVWAWPGGESWAGKALRLTACVLVGGASYLAASVLLRMPEPRWLLARAPGRAGDGEGGGPISMD